MPNTTTAGGEPAGAASTTAGSAATVTVTTPAGKTDPAGFASDLVAAVIKEVKAVGRSRALHAMASGVISSVLLAVVPVILANVGAMRWDRSWWLATGSLVASAALTGVVSYVRHVLNPPTR